MGLKRFENTPRSYKMMKSCSKYRHQRNFVMECTLLLEREISDYLAMLLGIEVKNNLALSNKSGGLSFNNKVMLMIDIKAINAINKPKFQKLMEIRNRFAHDYDCNNFSNCYSNISGIRTFLEKNYGDKTSIQNSEPRNEKLFFELFLDLFEILTALLEIIKEKYKEFE